MAASWTYGDSDPGLLDVALSHVPMGREDIRLPATAGRISTSEQEMRGSQIAGGAYPARRGGDANE